MARFKCFTYQGDHKIKIIFKSTQAKWKKVGFERGNWSTLGKTCCSRINSQQIQPSNSDCSPTEATFLPLIPFFYFVIITMLMIMVMMKMILLTTVAITMFKLFIVFPLNCSSKDKVLCTISPQLCRLSLYFSNFCRSLLLISWVDLVG